MALPTNRTKDSTITQHVNDHNTLAGFYNTHPDLVASGKGFVNHGATAGTARPTGYASVEWFGSVEPTNALDGDTWVDTSA